MLLTSTDFRHFNQGTHKAKQAYFADMDEQRRHDEYITERIRESNKRRSESSTRSNKLLWNTRWLNRRTASVSHPGFSQETFS